MEKCIEIEGNKYYPNKRYSVEGEPHKMFYYKRYVNKEGKCKFYKYYCINKGTKGRGRPVSKRTKIDQIIKKCNKEQLDIIYKLLQNIKIEENDE